MCWEKRVESLFKYEKEIAQFFLSFLLLLFFVYTIFCVMCRGKRERASSECTKAGECTHPYKRKIEAERRTRVVCGWGALRHQKRGDIYHKAERTKVAKDI